MNKIQEEIQELNQIIAELQNKLNRTITELQNENEKLKADLAKRDKWAAERIEMTTNDRQARDG